MAMPRGVDWCPPTGFHVNGDIPPEFPPQWNLSSGVGWVLQAEGAVDYGDCQQALFASNGKWLEYVHGETGDMPADVEDDSVKTARARTTSWDTTCQVVASFLVLTAVALGGTPNLVDFQGTLQAATGAPESGDRQITFSLYRGATDGEALWTETQTVQVLDGVYSTSLGAVTAFADSIWETPQLWLGIKVGQNDELTPRLRIVAVPYARKAARADSAAAADTATTATSAQTAANADHATLADTATNATHATHATNADNATAAATATAATTAEHATHATTADSATNANRAAEADHASSAASATRAATADSVAGTGLPGGTVLASTDRDDANLRAMGFALIGTFEPSRAFAWSPVSTISVPEGRESAAAVWTGEEVLIWGGTNSNSQFAAVGGRYNVAGGTWRSMSTADGPGALVGYTMTWMGDKAAICGGVDAPSSPPRYSGRFYTYIPSDDSWVEADTSEFLARTGHRAVWTGSRLLVWGGATAAPSNPYAGVPLDSGALYNPSTGFWSATTTDGAPVARTGHTMLWTGSKAIVWGGNTGGVSSSGGVYDPDGNCWTATSMGTGKPSNRDLHTAVWTGTRMIIWGGSTSTGVCNDGAAYDPVTDTWSSITTVQAPAARTTHYATWTGRYMVVWGGVNNNGTPIIDGGAYDPIVDKWYPLPVSDGHAGGKSAAVVGIGTRMFIWGGATPSERFLTTGTICDPRMDTQPTLYFYRKQ